MVKTNEKRLHDRQCNNTRKLGELINSTRVQIPPTAQLTDPDGCRDISAFQWKDFSLVTSRLLGSTRAYQVRSNLGQVVCVSIQRFFTFLRLSVRETREGSLTQNFNVDPYSFNVRVYHGLEL